MDEDDDGPSFFPTPFVLVSFTVNFHGRCGGGDGDLRFGLDWVQKSILIGWKNWLVLGVYSIKTALLQRGLQSPA